MTSSDATALRPGAVEENAARVGASYAGSVAPGAGGDVKVAVVCAKFNGGITERLLTGVLAGLDANGVKPASVSTRSAVS